MFPSRLVPPSLRAAMWPALFMLAACSGGGGGGGGGGSAPAPVAVADAYVFPPPATQLAVAAPGVLSNDSGAPTTAVLVGAPTHAASFTFNADGSFTYTNDGTSPDAFSYRATNASGSSSVVTVSLTPNTAPVAVNACKSTPAGTSVSGTLTANDEPASQPDTYSLVSDPIGPLKGNVIVNANGTFTYIPNNPSYVGMDKFKFQVTDKFNLTSTGIATVLINGAVRIMPLGDSITEGVWYDDPSSSCNDPVYFNCPAPGVRVSYRQKLYNDLEDLSPNYAVDMVGSHSNGGDTGLTQPEHEGWPGYSTLQLANGVNTWLTGNPPDIILLHAGTNSFSTNATNVNTLLNNINNWVQAYYPGIPPGNYPVTIFVARIIQTVQGIPNSITDADVTTFNNNVLSVAGNRTNVKVIMVNQQSGAGITYTIDTSPACLNTGVCTLGDMANVLHPNPGGYVKMANKWKVDLQASTILPTCP